MDFLWTFSTRAFYLDGSDNPRENGWVADASLDGARFDEDGQPSTHLSAEQAHAICDFLGINIARLEQDEADRAAERAAAHGRRAA